MDEIANHNRAAWNKQAREGCRWSIPASAEEIAAARAGTPRIILTPDTAVPADWLGNLKNRDVLCLASGGGQQAPLLAAAGATVTSFDLSDEQLALDRQVAEREGLDLHTVQGDMRDLSALADASYDLIVHVCSNTFCPEIRPVWLECQRVLRTGGDLLTGLLNPAFFLFDHDATDRGETPVATYPLPYDDESSLPPERYQQLIEANEPIIFGHSLDDQIGGQLEAGFHLVGFFEDSWTGGPALDKWFKTMICTRARKM